ncbi:MAG: spore maturation protein [bacterium]|nr:spore maturation protein [bacterium]MDY3861902.1 spore maturation protein [Ruminococcus sp.]
MNFIIPAFIAITVAAGFIKKVPVFSAFADGAKKGLLTLYRIAPTLIGLIVAVDMLKASSAMETLCSFLSPVAQTLGFPKEIIPMVLLRPVSGSGSTALLNQLYSDCGPDSFAGRVASVLAGSTETTFYAVTLYFGSTKVKNIRHTLWVALTADFTAAVMAVLTVRIFFGM